MELILLGHIIGDFYVQTDKIAEKKKNSIKYMLLHCLIYTIVMVIGLYELSRGIVETFIISSFMNGTVGFITTGNLKQNIHYVNSMVDVSQLQYADMPMER